MKIKVVINTYVDTRTQEQLFEPYFIKGHNEMVPIWEGEIDIKEDNVYLTKVSILTDGVAHPICDIPFSLTTGYWQWIPADIPDDWAPDTVEVGEGTVLNRAPLFRDLSKVVLPRMSVVRRRLFHRWRRNG